MRTFKRLLFFLVAALAVAVFVLSFFGVSTKYGDITTTYVNNINSINFENDFGNVVRVVMKTTDDVEPTAEELDEIKHIMEKRLELLNMADYSVYCDYENGNILVELPLSTAVVSDFEWILSVLGATGEIYGVEGTENSDDRIFTTNDVAKAKFRSEINSYNTGYNYYLDIRLNSAGKGLLRQATEEMTSIPADEGDEGDEGDVESEETISKTISIWYEDTSQGTFAVEKAVKNGNFTVWISSSMDATVLNEMILFLNSGQLPHEMSYDLITSAPATLGVDAVDHVGLILACGFGLVFVYLIIRFRLLGFAGFISTLGAVGFATFFATGFMQGRGYEGTIAALAALILVALIGIEITIRENNAIVSALQNGSVMKALPEGRKATLTTTLIVCVSALVMAILLVLCGFNGTIASLLRVLGLNQTGIAAAGTFGSVLIPGICGVVLFNVLGTRVMVNSLATWAKKPTLYGGGKNE